MVLMEFGNEERKLKVEKKWLLYATMLVEDGVMERGTRGKS